MPPATLRKMGDGTDSIADGETLYRRIRLEWFERDKTDKPSPHSFRPPENDPSGLSLYRAKYHTPESIASALGRRQYWVGVVRAGDIRGIGLDVVPAPRGPDELGHCEIPQLRSATRDSAESREWQVRLAQELCVEVLGPYPPRATAQGSEKPTPP